MKKAIYVLLLVASCLGACTKMDHEYVPYLASGETFYTGVPYALETHPGRGRLEVQFTQSKDPNVTRYVISWNNGKDHLDVKPAAETKQKVVIPGLAEGDYTFEVTAYDKAGNASTPKSAVIGGTSLGSTYESGLVVRKVSVYNSMAGILLDFASVDTLCKYTIVTYTTVSGTTDSMKYTKGDAFLDTLKNASGALSYIQLKTAYVPQAGIDTFYATQSQPVNVAAGKYVCTGTMKDYTSTSITGPYPWNITLRFVTALQLELVDNDYSNDVYHKILSAGSNSYYGTFGVVFNMDKDYNVVSVVNKYGQPSSGGRSGELDPSGVNKFDPQTRTLKVKYWMNQPGATHRTSFDETFTMK
ncbi:MAG TPA: DUF4998 domain-containing protein [Chitinophaga sp.]|uniref:DUF4998 domain-containing protein n=1 Tax=Chitinophaga sp. TaxID=1869181 RepID=UPI002D0559D5|nr:DUF4998 domain-containing protein [Chitinophaga sp.]HVI44853.1 DUF4998 domain-containing protein [Chitinophaga sp.]